MCAEDKRNNLTAVQALVLYHPQMHQCYTETFSPTGQACSRSVIGH